MHTTHEVTNQPPPLGEYDLFATDRGLAAGLVREGGGWAEARVRAFGATVGGEPFVWGQQANAYPPVLRTHDRFGHRIDEVEYHPAWHALMRRAIEHELHALPWRAARPGAHVARAALFYLQSQAEAGHGCPISMTYAVLPALRVHPDDVRPAPAAGGAEGRGALRHGDDREAGRLRRAHEHDPRPPARSRRAGRRIRAHRPQVVLLGPDVRCVPDARPGRARAQLLPRAALAARRHAQRDPPP